MKKIPSILLPSMILLLSTGGACGPREDAGGAKELTVLCGSSFVKPTEELIHRFTEETGIAVKYTVAGSEDFLPLVKAGKEGDVLVTHDPYLQYVTDAGACADHVTVGRLAPVLAVRKGNPKGIRSIGDLARPGLRVALPDPRYSTCGGMVAELLEKKGIEEGVMKNVGSRLTKGHSTLGTFLKTGVVDAAILWNGVARQFADALEVVPVPYEYGTRIRVHVIGLDYTKHPAELKRFMAFAGAHGPEIFARFGYEVKERRE